MYMDMHGNYLPHTLQHCRVGTVPDPEKSSDKHKHDLPLTKQCFQYAPVKLDEFT